MRTTFFLALASIVLAACGAPIGPNQADGADCNVVEASPCGPSSFCDHDAPTPRTHTYGFMDQASHAVGTCRPRGAAGAACSVAEGCVSGSCVHATPDAPGVCGP